MIWKLTPPSWSRRAQQSPAKPAPIIRTSGLHDMLAVSSRDWALPKTRQKETHILTHRADLVQAPLGIARTAACARRLRKRTARPSRSSSRRAPHSISAKRKFLRPRLHELLA